MDYLNSLLDINTSSNNGVRDINIDTYFDSYFAGGATKSDVLRYRQFRIEFGQSFKEKILCNVFDKQYKKWFSRIMQPDFIFPTHPKTKINVKAENIKNIYYDTYLLCQITTYLASTSSSNNFPDRIKFSYTGNNWKPEHITLSYIATILDPNTKIFKNGYINYSPECKNGYGIQDLTKFEIEKSFVSKGCFRKYRLLHANVKLINDVNAQIFLHDSVYFLYIDYTSNKGYPRKIIKILPKEFPQGSTLIDAVYELHPQPYAPIS